MSRIYINRRVEVITPTLPPPFGDSRLQTGNTFLPVTYLQRKKEHSLLNIPKDITQEYISTHPNTDISYQQSIK